MQRMDEKAQLATVKKEHGLRSVTEVMPSLRSSKNEGSNIQQVLTKHQIKAFLRTSWNQSLLEALVTEGLLDNHQVSEILIFFLILWNNLIIVAHFLPENMDQV